MWKKLFYFQKWPASMQTWQVISYQFHRPKAYQTYCSFKIVSKSSLIFPTGRSYRSVETLLFCTQKGPGSAPSICHWKDQAVVDVKRSLPELPESYCQSDGPRGHSVYGSFMRSSSLDLALPVAHFAPARGTEPKPIAAASFQVSFRNSTSWHFQNFYCDS